MIRPLSDDFPTQVAILRIAGYVWTLFAIYYIWRWRSLTNRFWLKWVFTVLPPLWAVFVAYSIAAYNFGVDIPTLLLVLTYLSSISTAILIYLLGHATNIVRAHDTRIKSTGKASTVLAGVIEDMTRLDAFRQHFLKS